MILFEKDWSKYPEAIVHTSTTNTSFLDLASIYKKMGVSNYYFMLALHDRRLLDIDPYKENKTPEEIAMIVTELAINPWYWFREIAPVPGSDVRMPFLANRANISMFWCYFNHCDYYGMLPRQNGKTLAVEMLFTYLLMYQKNIDLLGYTKDPSLRKKNIESMKRIIALLPKDLNLMTKDDPDNQESLGVGLNNTTYSTSNANTNEEAAYKIGRGFRVATRWSDEIAFCANAHLTIPSAGSATDAARQVAAKLGKPYGNIYTTTPGKLDTPHWAWGNERYMEACEWDEALLDSFDAKEFEQRVRAGSTPTNPLARKTGVFAVSGIFSHRQLGKSDEWLVDNMVRNGSYGEDALRDYFNISTSGSESSPFNTQQNELIAMSQIDPEYRDIGLGGLTFKWYYPKEVIDKLLASRPIVVGLDTSLNVGKDSTAMTLIDGTTLDVLGCGDCNNTNLLVFSKWLLEFMLQYPGVVLVPENKMSGQGVLDYLIETLPNYGIDPFKRIFNVIFQEKETQPDRYREVRDAPSKGVSANRHRGKFGYITSGAGKYSRNNLYNETLYKAIDLSADRLKDKRLVKELLNLVVVDGRIDHRKGMHDDQVISWLLACWFVFNGRGISDYQLNPGKLLSSVHEAKKDIKPEERMLLIENKKIKDNIESLLNEMESISDPFLFNKYEKKVKILEATLHPQHQLDYSVEQVLSDLKNKGRKEKQTTKTDTGLYQRIISAF